MNFRTSCSMVLAALFVGAAMTACVASSDPRDSSDSPPRENTGTVSLAVLGTTATGTTYRLEGAQFSAVGPTTQTISGDTDVVSVDLPTGSYQITLESGWTLQKLVDGAFQPVNAVLVSTNPQTITVFDQKVTYVRFDFLVGDDVIAIGDGRVNIGIGVSESSGPTCGACPAGLVCDSATGTCMPPTCVPIPCAARGAACGLMPDGCGGMVSCDTCPPGTQCDSAINACIPTCMPLTCAQLGLPCGIGPDGCGGQLDCGVCVPTCTDGIKNGAETDVDCGGTCAPCSVGRACVVAADCASGLCNAGVCVSPPPNLVTNGDFSNGTAHWNVTYGTATASGGTVCISGGSITNAVTLGWPGTGESGFTLTPGATYSFSFDAWASSSLSATAKIGGTMSPYTAYSNRTVSVGTVKQTFSTTFTAAMSSPTLVGLAFSTNSSSTLCFDNVSVTMQ